MKTRPLSTVRLPKSELGRRPFHIAFRTAVIFQTAPMFAACATSPERSLASDASKDRSVSLGKDVTLAPGESAVAPPSALRLTFVSVAGDSRCPNDPAIQCVWGGSARVALRVSGVTTAGDRFLETLAAKDTVTVDGYLITLVGVSPYPATLTPIAPSAYRATVRVTSK